MGPPWWNDGVVFLVGGGPSLAGFDFGRLRSAGYCVGVNQGMFDAPACAGVTADRIFVQRRYADLATFAAICPLYIAIGNVWLHIAPQIPDATYLQELGGYGVSKKQTHIHGGSTSGFAALNVAVLKGARRILLLGYDYGLIGGRHHYHDRYDGWFDPHSHWAGWAKQFNDMTAALDALDVRVMNASPDSAITAFPRCTVEEGLAWACAIG